MVKHVIPNREQLLRLLAGLPLDETDPTALVLQKQQTAK